MQAIGVERFGDQPQLMEVALPEPGSGQVEVELSAAAKNPLDSAVAAGYLAELGEYRFPLVLGFDGAGVVRRVGNEVNHFAVGDRVFGQFWSLPMQYGTYAEAALVQARPAFGALRRIPDGVGFTEAAASPTAGMTAAGAVELSAAAPGDTLLLLGATGGVGTFAIQEATARGIHVIASSDQQAAQALRALGAREILPRDRDALADAISQLDTPVAAALDFAGDPATTAIAARALKQGGVLISTANGIPDLLRVGGRIHVVDYVLDRKPDRLDHLADRLAAGSVRPVIGAEVDLANALAPAPSAQDGLRGKTVIRIRH